VVHLDGDPGGWVVDEVQTCNPKPGTSGGVTATTGAAPVPDTLALPPSNMTVPAVTAPTVSASGVTAVPASTTSTTVMGGP
jgi:hypothetical protein